MSMQHGVQQIHMQSLNVVGSTYLDSTEAERCALSGTANLSGTRGCGGTLQQFGALRGSRYNN
jgi:hypothetical protein